MDEIDFGELSIRAMKKTDIEAVIEIDSKVSGQVRREYFEKKMTYYLGKGAEKSVFLVAEHKNEVVGYIMGTLYGGEFGIPGSTAFLESLGIDLLFQKKGIANMLMDEFEANLKTLGVRCIQTLVDWDHWGLVSFFSATGFSPSPTLNLEKKI